MGDVATIRGLVMDAIEAIPAEASGAQWTRSRFAPELFGRDTRSLMHHAFAVGMPTTEPRDERQALVDGCLVFSTVEVQWAHSMRGDAQSDDYDGATDAEQALVKAVVAISSQNMLIVRLTRRAAAEGWVLGTATFRLLHRYTLV